jgi:queuosine precursor transporter
LPVDVQVVSRSTENVGYKTSKIGGECLNVLSKETEYRKPVPRIVFASLVGYLTGEFVNSFVLAKMKVLTRGRYLWTRTIGSTIAGQSVDTVLFVMVGFAGIWPRSQIVLAIASLYVLKVAYEVLATPITYIVVTFLKRTEGIDHYDAGTTFMPFRWKM